MKKTVRQQKLWASIFTRFSYFLSGPRTSLHHFCPKPGMNETDFATIISHIWDNCNSSNENWKEVRSKLYEDMVIINKKVRASLQRYLRPSLHCIAFRRCQTYIFSWKYGLQPGARLATTFQCLLWAAHSPFQNFCPTRYSYFTISSNS